MDKSANACSDEIERSKSHQRVRRSERTTRASNPSYRVPDSDEDDVSEEEEESEEGSKEESDEKLINGTFRKNQTVYVRGVCGRFHGGGPDNKGGYKLETGFGCESFFPRRLKCGSFGAPIRWRGKVQGYDRKSDMYEVAVFGHEYLEHELRIGLFREVEIIKREELNEEELKKLKDLYVTHLKERKKNAVFENMVHFDASEHGRKFTAYDNYYAPLFVPKKASRNKPSTYFHSLCGVCHSVCHSDIVHSDKPFMECERGCGAFAHVKCMNLESKPDSWSCPACVYAESAQSAKPACIICDRSTGLVLPVVKKSDEKNSDARRPSGSMVKDDGGVEWVHYSCAMVTEGFKLDTVKQEWVYFPKKRKQAKDAPACEICHKKTGIRVHCNKLIETGRTKTCGRAFHAMCAIDCKNYMVRAIFKNQERKPSLKKVDFRCKDCFEDPFVAGDL